MLALQPETIRKTILSEFSEEELAELEYDWDFWGRQNQKEPGGDWLTWLALAGRGFGKTEAGARWIKKREAEGATMIALIAETQKDLEEVMVPRILSLYPPEKAPTVRYKPVRITWHSGAVAYGYNGTEPNQLRGPEFDTAWIDELAKYRYARETWDMLQFTMRRGEQPRVFVTTTPRPVPVIREILKDKTTTVTRGSTFDNASNLPKAFLDKLKERYAGTRLGRQELEAELLDDVPGALWTLANIDETRISEAPQMQRVVVAVDPSGADENSESADEIGIVVAGLGFDGRGYVLADYTCSMSPAGWGRRAVEAYHEFKADRIVAERNFGGAMVKFVISTADKNAAYKEVTASRGKAVRAEPIAALYEQGRVSHVGELKELEDQMVSMTASGYVGDNSPDRLDAMVWALTELMVDGTNYTLENV